MKRPVSSEVEACRIRGVPHEPYGQFVIPYKSYELRAIASAGLGWEHVSVSRGTGLPTWEMMDYVKRLFWHDHEVVMQLHINDGNKVNKCANCLHLWRPMTMDENEDEKERWRLDAEPVPSKWATYGPIPLPPKELV